MFRSISKGRRAPRSDAPSLHDRKLAAWELLVGERPFNAERIDRSAMSHRGGLGDLDPGSAVPDPNHRSLLRRLADLVRSVLHPVDIDRSGASPAVAVLPDGGGTAVPGPTDFALPAHAAQDESAPYTQPRLAA